MRGCPHLTGRTTAPARRALAVALALALPAAAGPASLIAQSVTPPIAEYREHARSSFQLTNGTLFPLSVVLELRGFRVTEEGEVEDLPLDTTRVHVKLSAMSFRIPPRGTYTVFYQATADSLPAWFNILSALTGARTDTGLNVRVLLPHVVYLNQKAPLRKDEVIIRASRYDSATGKVRVQLENTGAHLGRVLALTPGPGDHGGTGGFPLFPHSRRWAEAAWAGTRAPSRLTVRFARFSIDTTFPGAP